MDHTPKTARPRGPMDDPLTQRDCEADGAIQRVVLVLDSERLCPHCGDTGMMREGNGHGGTVSSRCPYCQSFERRGLGGGYNFEPRLPSLLRAAA